MSGPVRSLGSLGLTLARQWWPQVAALAAACAVVTTTVVGALGVGDALQNGLLDLAVGRLGRIDAAVLATDFVRRGLADEIAGKGGAAVRAVPALLMPASISPAASASASSAQPARPAGGSVATLLACDDPAALGFDPPPPPLGPNAILVNDVLARVAGIRAGDTVVVRLPRRSEVPADSPLGRRSGDSLGKRMTVAAVLADAGLGRFAVRPTQVTPPLVVMSLEDAQAILREGDLANAVFVVGPQDGSLDAATWLRSRLAPRLADYGLTLEATTDGRHLRLTSRRLVIAAEADRAAESVLAPLGGRPTLVFLANELVPLDADGKLAAARIPYSTVLGIDGTSFPGGELMDAAGHPLPTPTGDGIVINRWLADDLAAQGRPVAVGDRLALRFFQPETIHGRVEEATADFRIAGIAEMAAGAIDRSLVPEVAGVTDEASIADWDPPFPFDQSRVRTVPPHDEDDRYWKQYRATPKAFVAIDTARRLAGSRFGTTTAWHLPLPAGTSPETLAARIAGVMRPDAAGLAVLPLRSEAIAAARGSTPFGGLFLALSIFVVAAALLLAWLLFGLLVAAHRRTIGLLSAVGWPPRRLAALLLVVGGIATCAGTAVGAVVGPLWSRALLAGLTAAWNRDVAVGSSAVFAAARPSWSMALPGIAATLTLSIAAVAAAARRAARLPPHALLAAAPALAAGHGRGEGRWWLRVGVVGVVVSAAAALAGRTAGTETAVALFFTSGFVALAGLLALVRAWLVGGAAAGPVRSLPHLAARMLAARPGRAFSIAAIVACGQFLVVAVSAFAVRPPADPDDRQTPTGGWTSIATFGEPTAVNPADPAARTALGLSLPQERAVAASTIALVRSSDGDDASCTNLYAAGRPVIVGVGHDFIDRGGFRFVASAPHPATDGNPWRRLDLPRPAGEGGPVPAVLDQATAQWGLKLGGVGSRFTLPDEAGAAVEFEIVGLLEPGILQGRIIVAERDFERIFPSRSGYSAAFIDLPPAAANREEAVAGLRAAWADAGVSFEPAIDRLRSLQAVQNTFLAGFQALGSLGLLLGTAGVAAVMLQGVVERLGNFALLCAVGFTRRRIRWLLVHETLATVGLGLAVGTAAGAVAVWPALAGGTARLPLMWIAATCGLTLASAAAAAWLATLRVAIPQRPR
ncbi:MAG: hypothetical protein K8S94_00590 [Planctomycetia bacterium]|nr:hypothetical protein [Planctomycetia bacterium]